MLDQDYTREDFFKKFPTARTFPQIIINGEFVGDFNNLIDYFKQHNEST